MINNKDEKRNVPADEGKNNDPNKRDDSAIQPGVSTVSKSDYDDDNQNPTKTASDNFREDVDDDNNADTRFDEVNKDE
jgi:hypothetical protein